MTYVPQLARPLRRLAWSSVDAFNNSPEDNVNVSSVASILVVLVSLGFMVLNFTVRLTPYVLHRSFL